MSSGRGEWHPTDRGPGIAEQILQLKGTIRNAGKHCGVMATSVENLVQRGEQGFRMLGIGQDSVLLLRSIHQALQAVNCDRTLATSLDPADGKALSTTGVASRT